MYSIVGAIAFAMFISLCYFLWWIYSNGEHIRGVEYFLAALVVLLFVSSYLPLGVKKFLDRRTQLEVDENGIRCVDWATEFIPWRKVQAIESRLIEANEEVTGYASAKSKIAGDRNFVFVVLKDQTDKNELNKDTSIGETDQLGALKLDNAHWSISYGKLLKKLTTLHDYHRKP